MQEVWGSDVPRRGIGTWGGWASQPPTGQLRDSVHAEAPPNPYLQCFEERLCRRLYATRPLCSGPKFCDDRCRHVATFPAFANFANSIMADMARYRCERRLVICSLRKAMVRDPAGLILPPHPRECCFHRRWAFPRHSLRDDSVRDDCAGSCISRFVSRAVQLEDLRTFLRRRLRRSVCVCVSGGADLDLDVGITRYLACESQILLQSGTATCHGAMAQPLFHTASASYACTL